MNRYRRIRMAALTGVCTLPLALAGCSLLPAKQAVKEIDPPQQTSQAWEDAGDAADTGDTGEVGNAAGSAENDPDAAADAVGASAAPDTGGADGGDAAADAGSAGAAGADADAGAASGDVSASAKAGSGKAASGQSHLTVYVRDHAGYLAPVTLNASFGSGEQAGRRALELMVDNEDGTSALPEGFSGILPKGTQVLNYKVDAQTKTATVDFSQSFTDYNAQDERRIVEAVTWTLTELPGVESVKLMSGGAALPEMPVDGFPLDEPLTRAVGINLEKADGVSYSDTMPVTLYFSSLSDAGDAYYVPVTRLVKREGDAAKAALEQLIAGPLATDDLSAVMTQDVQVKGVSMANGTVTVDLQDDTYEPGVQEPAEMLQALVLSMAENTGAAKVRIRMNGSDKVTGTDNAAYGQPVSRPDHINALKL